jgi:hypothetical protein
MTRFVEAVASAVVVAVLVVLLAWRVGADLVAGPAGAALVTFLAVMLRTRSAGRVRSMRRSAVRRPVVRNSARAGGRGESMKMKESSGGK